MFGGILHRFESAARDFGLDCRGLGGTYRGIGGYFGTVETFADETQLNIEKNKLATADDNKPKREESGRIMSHPLSNEFHLAYHYLQVRDNRIDHFGFVFSRSPWNAFAPASSHGTAASRSRQMS